MRKGLIATHPTHNHDCIFKTAFSCHLGGRASGVGVGLSTCHVIAMSPSCWGSGSSSAAAGSCFRQVTKPAPINSENPQKVESSPFEIVGHPGPVVGRMLERFAVALPDGLHNTNVGNIVADSLPLTSMLCCLPTLTLFWRSGRVSDLVSSDVDCRRCSIASEPLVFP